MSKFKESLDMELSFLQSDMTADDIMSKASKSKKIITFKKAVLIAASFILVLTMTFVPFRNNKSSFVIIANAEATADSATPDFGKITGDELNTETFVEIKSNEPNYIHYNLNYILDKNAEPTDLAKRYLFHSFNKSLNIVIEGEDIEKITYKINNGSLSSYTMLHADRNVKKIKVSNTSADFGSELTINYNQQSVTYFRFNPVISTDTFHNNLSSHLITDTGEIISGPSFSTIIGYCYEDDTTLATDNEIETLKQYIAKDDMVGFYNYQNQIFKRLIDGITLDVTVTKTNGKTETQTLEFLYTPDELKELPDNNEAIEKNQTLSTGTLSARIKR